VNLSTAIYLGVFSRADKSTRRYRTQAHGSNGTLSKRAYPCLEIQRPGVSAIEVRLAAGRPQPHCRSQRFDLPRDVAPSRQARSAHHPCGCGSRASGQPYWIDAGILPPGGFIAYAVHQSTMDSRERHRELVARLATQDPRLQVAQVDGSRMACGHRGGKAVGQRSEGNALLR
jgi:hypothetical protein